VPPRRQFPSPRHAVTDDEQERDASGSDSLRSMKAKPVAPQRSACPVNAALEALGARWVLLIVRDLMFRKRTRYKDFLKAGSSTGSRPRDSTWLRCSSR
jgi:hypothetical protein